MRCKDLIAPLIIYSYQGTLLLFKAICNACFPFLAAYIMHCGTLDGWTAVDKSRVKKALFNKSESHKDRVGFRKCCLLRCQMPSYPM